MTEDSVSVSFLNSLCRRYNLIFVELDETGKNNIYRFIDFEDMPIEYTREEMMEKMDL